MIFNVLFTAAIAATSALAQSFTINSPVSSLLLFLDDYS
jgi:hypothetical protein